MDEECKTKNYWEPDGQRLTIRFQKETKNVGIRKPMPFSETHRK